MFGPLYYSKEFGVQTQELEAKLKKQDQEQLLVALQACLETLHGAQLLDGGCFLRSKTHCSEDVMGGCPSGLPFQANE
jgi:hypothetical protein